MQLCPLLIDVLLFSLSMGIVVIRTFETTLVVDSNEHHNHTSYNTSGVYDKNDLIYTKSCVVYTRLSFVSSVDCLYQSLIPVPPGPIPIPSALVPIPPDLNPLKLQNLPPVPIPYRSQTQSRESHQNGDHPGATPQ